MLVVVAVLDIALSDAAIDPLGRTLIVRIGDLSIDTNTIKVLRKIYP